jgi:2'-5' RNA ligase
MTKKRLFIAINLPDAVKKKISDVIASLDLQINRKVAKQIGFRWMEPESWHLTISFLGYQLDEAIGPILKSMKEVGGYFAAFEIEFEDIIWAPADKAPRMIWMTGKEKTSNDLAGLKNKLEDLLIENGVRFKPEIRKYNAHLTLARFSDGKNFNDLNIDLSGVVKNIFQSLNFVAQNIDLMESEIEHGGARYIILQKEKLRK